MCALFAERSAGASGLARLGLLFGAVTDVVTNAAAAHWDVLIQDLRHTRRSLKGARGFAVSAVAVIAIGVGANTAAFSVADFVLLRPPSRAVRICRGSSRSARTQETLGAAHVWRMSRQTARSSVPVVASRRTSSRPIDTLDPDALKPEPPPARSPL
jgi:hypothetical protein